MFKKVLIANRGEIALRILRTLHSLGIPSVSLYVASERRSPHVAAATESHLLEGDSVAESYLNIDLILSLAKKRGCDAIHPGYGFLAENPDFSEACRKKKISFIGPSPEAMRLVGNKLSSRELAESVGVPVVPYAMLSSGTLPPAEQKRLGLPLMIKAAAGGGGKGLKRIGQSSEIASAIESAQREALAAFGNRRVYAEKYLERVRHIEVQVLSAGKTILCLGERECSAQRRHQKIIEESPSPFVDEKLREKLFEAARKIMQGAGYENAGTVEFLVDEAKHFYFLEVNSRLQVEHPVTEMRTGLDLVKLQMEIAAGRRLSVTQEEVVFKGHAIEARLNAENPELQFLPSSGHILSLYLPQNRDLRIDTALTEKGEVSPLFDPLLGKVIAWGKNREAARSLLIESLRETRVLGVGTNIDFLKYVLSSEEFQRGKIFTSSVEPLAERYLRDLAPIEPLVALAAAFVTQRGEARGEEEEAATPWTRLGRWRI